ncbi:hypothetical protein GCM10025783_19300 [Amnibacterium soli]|uniref:DUF5666 domain-containing protein n=1 Tax=Amnibacterium soli TaxID=1282736 RepID=A0ABP8Z5S2_9MICO
MQSFLRPSRRAAIVGGAAGLALVGAVGFGTVAFADSAPTPGASQSAPAPAASGAPSGAPAAPGAPGGPAAPGAGGPGAKAHAPHIGGKVLTVDGSTVTVKDHDGFTRTIRLGDDVKVTKDDASSSTSAIAKGAWIEASGTVDSNGTTLDATEVRIGQPTPPKGGPIGPGGRAGAQGAPAAPEGGAKPQAPEAPAASGSAAPAAPQAPTASGAPEAPAPQGSASAATGS